MTLVDNINALLVEDIKKSLQPRARLKIAAKLHTIRTELHALTSCHAPILLSLHI